MEETTEHAVCRGCGKQLRGTPYFRGGDAFDPVTGERCKTNHYGGYVCSKDCDFASSLELERSMPGHDGSQSRLGCYSERSYQDNWANEEG